MTSLFRSIFGGSSAPSALPKTVTDPMAQAMATGDIARMAFLANQARQAQTSQTTHKRR